MATNFMYNVSQIIAPAMLSTSERVAESLIRLRRSDPAWKRIPRYLADAISNVFAAKHFIANVGSLSYASNAGVQLLKIKRHVPYVQQNKRCSIKTSGRFAKVISTERQVNVEHAVKTPCQTGQRVNFTQQRRENDLRAVERGSGQMDFAQNVAHLWLRGELGVLRVFNTLKLTRRSAEKNGYHPVSVPTVGCAKWIRAIKPVHSAVPTPITIAGKRLSAFMKHTVINALAAAKLINSFLASITLTVEDQKKDGKLEYTGNGNSLRVDFLRNTRFFVSTVIKQRATTVLVRIHGLMDISLKGCGSLDRGNTLYV